MKKYRITVNGKSYEVDVEEIGGQGNTPAAPAPAAPAPKAPAETPKTPKSETSQTQKKGSAGKSQINCPMPGTILSIKVKVGDKVSKGDVVMILEAMKMENEILAPEDGIITSIDTSEGASVNTGDILATFE
jgi:biotin carboxyl carrier protein